MPRLYPYGQQKLDLQSPTAGLPGFLGGGPKSGSAGRTCAQPDFFGEIFCLYQLGFITGSRKSRYLSLKQGGKRRHSLSYGEYFQRSGRVREQILFPCAGAQLVFIFHRWEKVRRSLTLSVTYRETIRNKAGEAPWLN